LLSQLERSLDFGDSSALSKGRICKVLSQKIALSDNAEECLLRPATSMTEVFGPCPKSSHIRH
jgi:hypothetical protein